MRKIKAVIERALDGSYSIFMDAEELPYLITGTGNSAEQARREFMNGYEDMQNLFLEEGKPFEEVSFEFVYDVPSFLRQYALAFSLAGLERITGVNQKQLSHYVNGNRKPSDKTVRKIQEGITRFCNELSAVKLSV